MLWWWRHLSRNSSATDYCLSVPWAEVRARGQNSSVYRFVYSVFVLLLLLCCAFRSTLYCNIHSDLCTLCLSCYYFYIVLSLYLYCCYVVYLDQHFTVLFLQTWVLCVCLVITSTLFYLYNCTVAMLCIQINTLL